MEGAWGGRLPAVYGHEASGVVDEVGPGVALIRPGDHVVVGMPAAGIKAQIEALDLADRGQAIIGSKMGSARLNIDVPQLVELYEQIKNKTRRADHCTLSAGRNQRGRGRGQQQRCTA